MFAADSTYGSLQYFWLLGGLLPIAFWLIIRRWPHGPARYLNAPVILGGTGQIPPAVPMNYMMWGLVGFIFNKYIRGRYRGWWSQYNYILSASLDAGLALATIFIFVTLQMTKTEPPKWWGNNVVTSTIVSFIPLAFRVLCECLANIFCDRIIWERLLGRRFLRERNLDQILGNEVLYTRLGLSRHECVR